MKAIGLFMGALCAASGALADVPHVATDIAPVQSLVARVMEGLGTPDLVVPAGASPHGYAMRPSQARALSRAHLVVWIGPALTPWLEEGLASLSPDARRLTLLEVPSTVKLGFRAGPAFAPHEHGPVDPDAADDHGEDHDHAGAVDPHGWLDPRNGAAWLGAIAEALSGLDPQNSATYRANALAGQQELAALEDRIAGELGPVRGVPFIVFHDAYHYFEARFDLEASASISLGDAAAPGPQRLADVRDVVQQSGARCAFAEPQFSPGLIEAVTQGAEIETAVLDPLGAVAVDVPGLYPAILSAIADTMSGCLGR